MVETLFLPLASHDETIKPVTVGSLAYIRMDDLAADVIKMAPITNSLKEPSSWGYMLQAPVTFTFEQLFTLSSLKTEFAWYSSDEERIEKFKQRITEQRKTAIEEERLRQELETSILQKEKQHKQQQAEAIAAMKREQQDRNNSASTQANVPPAAANIINYSFSLFNTESDKIDRYRSYLNVAKSPKDY